MVDKITKSVDSGDIVIHLFVDLKKAFDTVSHSILVKKLHAYGIRGNILELCASYLENRKQLPLCKLYKCFDIYLSHDSTVNPDGVFIRELCLLRDDYSLTDNNDNACDITREEVSYIINHLCMRLSYSL